MFRVQNILRFVLICGSYNNEKMADLNWALASFIKATGKHKPGPEDTADWQAVNGDAIADNNLAALFFAAQKKLGSTAILTMQRIAGVRADGNVGPITTQAINDGDPEELYDLYRESLRNLGLSEVFLSTFDKAEPIPETPKADPPISEPAAPEQEPKGCRPQAHIALYAAFVVVLIIILL